MSAPMTLDAALTRLRQYGERTSTWSTATYNDGTEKALHKIALTLAAEVDRLSDDLTGANLATWEEQQETARMRSAWESARRGRRDARLRCELAEAERDALRTRVTELEAARRPTAEFVSFSAMEEGDRVRFATADNGYGGMGEFWRTGTVARVTARTVVVECDENLLGDTAVLRQAEWGSRSVRRAPAEDPHDSPLHHEDALGRDLPKVKADSPWEQAVAGLNALVDADVIFHVEPDGHISAPFSDEHIEWDLRARRWVLTRDDEDGAS